MRPLEWSLCCFKRLLDPDAAAKVTFTVAQPGESLEGLHKRAVVHCRIVNGEYLQQLLLLHDHPNLEDLPGITVIAVGLTCRVPAIS